MAGYFCHWSDSGDSSPAHHLHETADFWFNISVLQIRFIFSLLNSTSPTVKNLEKYIFIFIYIKDVTVRLAVNGKWTCLIHCYVAFCLWLKTLMPHCDVLHISFILYHFIITGPVWTTTHFFLVLMWFYHQEEGCMEKAQQNVLMCSLTTSAVFSWCFH